MLDCCHDPEFVESESVSRRSLFLKKLPLPKLSQITSDQIESVVKAMGPAMAGHTFNTVLTTIALWGAISHYELIAWAVISCSIAAFTLLRRLRAKPSKRKAPSRKFFIRSVISATLLALPWAYLVVRFLGSLEQVNELVLITVVVGMAAGGGILLAPIFPAALTYVAVILVPTLIKFFFFAPDPAYLILGGFAVSYCAFLVGVIGVTARLSIENSENRRQRDVASTAASAAKIMATSSLKQLNAMEVEKQVAESAAADRSLLLATMSHEIRTPINGVLGALDLIRDENLSERGRHCVKMATDSGETLLDLINDILLFSKSENGELDLYHEEFDLESLVETTKSVMINSIRKSTNEITFSVASAAARPLIGDEPRLKQVLVNLISNANKFTQNGTIALSIDILRDDGDELAVRFSVTDTGIGIPKEKQGLIFNRFQTLDPSYTRRTDGTGLGLAICDQVVRSMGGEIKLESEVGRGSRFYFDLVFPCAEEEISAPASQAVVDPQAKAARPLRVLLAEDNPTNAYMTTQFLVDAGHEVHHAENGRRAVELAAAHNFDLILMDISMPEMDGIEATKAVRALNAHNAAIRIIALTAHATEGDEEKFLAAQMNEYLTKPIRKSVLLSALAGHPTDAAPSPEPAEAQASEADVIIDMATFGEFVSDRTFERYSRSIGIFLMEARQKEAALRETIDARDLPGLSKLAHSTLGSGAMVGATRLVNLSRAIETDYRDTGTVEWSDADALLTTFGETIEAFEMHLTQEAYDELTSRTPAAA